MKAVVFIVIGMILGAWAGDANEEMLGLLAGGLIGYLLARLQRLENRVREWQFERPPAPAARQRSEPQDPQTTATPAEAPLASAWTTESEIADKATTEPFDPELEPLPPTRTSTAPAMLTGLLGRAREWVTSGNVPAKVGVIISFIGFSFLLKYAVDRQLIYLSLHMRLIAVALVGLVMLVIGWRLRKRRRVYSLSLQGGGLGILFLTVFAAFRVWSLLPPGLAFSLLALLAAATGVLALIQEARTLAIFATAGGFLAPLLASTGQGSHVALFSYYLVINGAVLGLAWFRAWRGLNLLGWAFTFVIGCYWGYQYYRPELFSTVEPFLVLFFLAYNAIAVLYALRQPPHRMGLVDGTLVFGTPVVVFAVQAALLGDSEYGLAWSAVALAAFYASMAFFLTSSRNAGFRLLIESYQALAVAFATLAIPLALDARWTAGAWALEGAALVWIGMRQSRHLANLAGTVLIFGAGFAFLDAGWRDGQGLAVLNGNVLGGLLISLSALFAARSSGRHAGTGLLSDEVEERAYGLASAALFIWAIAWWIGTGLFEVIDRATPLYQSHAFLLFLSASAWLSMRMAGTLDWPRLRRPPLLLGAFMVIVAALDVAEQRHFLFGIGWFAWPAAWAVHVGILRKLEEMPQWRPAAWHFCSAFLLTGLVAIECHWQIRQLLSETWASAAAIAVAGLLPGLVHAARRYERWPVHAHADTYRHAAILIVMLQAWYLSVLSIAKSGNPSPLFYLPVFNPFDLAMLAVGGSTLLALNMLRTLERPVTIANGIRWYLGAAFFVMTTAALVRGVYHVHGGSWRWDALFESVVVQASLSIYWAVLGFGGMIWGARSKRRPVWLAGAGFMLLVVLKLFAVDLTQTGTVERIVSFIGVGILLLVVGYFAPAPPRAGK